MVSMTLCDQDLWLSREQWKRCQGSLVVGAVSVSSEFCSELQCGPKALVKNLRDKRVRIVSYFLTLIHCQNTTFVRFAYLVRLCNLGKTPEDMRKFPQKCQKIACCDEGAVYCSRPPIASTPD